MFYSYSIADFFELKHEHRHFHINRLEAMPILPSRIKSPHKHQFYEVLLIKEGNTIQNVDYQEFNIQSATLFFISQGQLHLWGKTDRSNIRGYRLMFTEDFFLLNHIDKNFLFELVFLDNIYFNPCISVSNEANSTIYKYFDLLFEEYERDDANSKVLQSLLFLTLTEVQRITTHQKSNMVVSKEIGIYKKFLELLEDNFKKHLPIGDYAGKLCLSQKQFTRIIQGITHQSVSDVIKNRIILEAKRLLTCTDMNINQISYELGFEDSAYFARFFRRETQQSPTEFKNITVEMYRKAS